MSKSPVTRSDYSLLLTRYLYNYLRPAVLGEDLIDGNGDSQFTQGGDGLPRQVALAQ
jgi:hypothetical protein